MFHTATRQWVRRVLEFYWKAGGGISPALAEPRAQRVLTRARHARARAACVSGCDKYIYWPIDRTHGQHGESGKIRSGSRVAEPK